MSAESPVCPTVLLDDIPATEDAFGPHKRIADAIVSLVTSEPGGRAIGVEGGWGSGKSTVVAFVRSDLKSHDNFRVITFDAWAHEGDPLRRTYLEGIIGDLIDAGWIASDKWAKTLEELGNRLKSTTTRITPKPTWLGGIFAVSLVLVPIGTTLVTSAFRQGGNASIADLSTWPWIAYLGSAVALAPLLVLLLNGVRVVLRDGFRWLRSFTPWPAKRAKPTSDWSFLLSKAIEETRTDTTETPNPTSIEFEAHFTRAMKEALGSDPKRRLALVLDNLDRVDTQSAISVWSTLQTFLQERNSLNSSWFKQIWVVVPYDPKGLRKLWDNWRAVPSGDNSTLGTQSAAPRQSVASDSFIDKSFQIRFQVPPPVLSDWKTYLSDLIKKALPDHNETDRHVIYRVYEEWRSSQAMPPTPRELKLYVNQIGSVHRQWQHEFPIAHVAYYVLLSKQSDSLIEQLKASDFPPANIQRLFKEDVIPSLAGLTFNVPANKGMELLLSDPIHNCLTKGTGAELNQLRENYKDGFWAITEGVVATRIVDTPGSVIAHAGRVLADAELLGDDLRVEAQEIRRTLADAVISVQDWQPLDADVADGVCAIHRLFNNRELSASVMKSVADSVSQSKGTDKKLDVATLPGALLTIMATVADLGFEDVLPPCITMPGDVESWINTCEALYREDAGERYIKHFRPKEKPDAVTTAIQTAVGAGEFAERHIAALIVTTKSLPKTDWSSVVSAIQTRLDAGTGTGADEMRPLLRGLWVLRNLGDGKATKSLKTLVNEGHIAHHLHQSAKHKEGAALCQFTMLVEDPSAATPPAIGNSASGHQHLINAIGSSDKAAAKMLCETIRKYGDISQVFQIIDARGSCEPLLASCMQSIAEGDAPQELFTNGIVLTRWSQIQQALASENDDRPFDQLIARLADEHGLCEDIQATEKGFATDDAILYWTIVRAASKDNVAFFNWCKAGLEGLSKDAWLSDLNDTNECVWLACMLSDKGVRVKLTTHFSDALEDHAEQVIKGNGVPEDAVLKRWPDVLSLLDDSTRRALQARLLNVAVSADGQLQGPFLGMYGGEFSSPSVLASNGRSVVGLFSPIVRERSLAGLKWLVEFFKNHEDFLSKVSANDNVGEFRTRLQDCVNNPTDDDAQPIIAELAGALGITAAVVESELGEAEENR